jgi:hypothetical protein
MARPQRGVNIVLAMLGMAGLRTYEKQKGLTK